MPPMLIFPRVNVNKSYLEGAPSGAWGEFNKTGWISEELFAKWFKEFVEFSKPPVDAETRLLLLDGHYSHKKNADIIDLAWDNNIEVLVFPPHCTHKLQPLDAAFMKPLSQYYSDAVSAEQRLGNVVGMKDVFR